MKSPLVALACLALSVAPVLGCGAADAEGPGAEYPQPMGVDAPEQEVAASSAPSAAPQPATSQQLAEQEQAGGAVAGGADAYAEPQSTDIAVGADANAYADTDPSALEDFRQPLAPYGSWVEDAQYGTVWVPSRSVVGADFAPYVTAGHWAYDDDWVWVSDYDWGWAPFHYGRWVYAGGRGWAWIPGRTYAGAWVTWRYGYDDWGYVGWAPLPPTWYWYGGMAVGVAFVPPAPYVFCGYHDVFAPVVATRVVTGSQVPVVAAHTRPYVPAQPAVAAGRVTAHPVVGGPSPGLLKIPPAQVAHAPAQNVGLLRARQFAQPATAQAIGARPPIQTSIARANPTVGIGAARNGFAAPRVGGTMPAYGGNAAVATAPQYRGVQPQPYHAAPSVSAPRGYAAPSYAAPRGYAAPSYSAPHPSAPAYAAPSYARPSAPAYTPRPAAPAYSAPAYAHPAAPVYSAPHVSAPVQAPHVSAPVSAPSYSAPRPSGGFHGGGGFRGGSSIHVGGGRR